MKNLKTILAVVSIATASLLSSSANAAANYHLDINEGIEVLTGLIAEIDEKIDLLEDYTGPDTGARHRALAELGNERDALQESLDAYYDAFEPSEENPRTNVEDACGVYLCLPFGFALPGCDAAFSAMTSRLFRGKSPAPSFSSCTSDGKNPDGIRLTTGLVAYIPPATFEHSPMGCEPNSEGDNLPMGCVAEFDTFQMRQGGTDLIPGSGIPYGARFINANGTRVLRDERGHCDAPEDELHPALHASCFDVDIVATEDNEVTDVSTDTFFERHCVVGGSTDSWCHTANGGSTILGGGEYCNGGSLSDTEGATEYCERLSSIRTAATQ